MLSKIFFAAGLLGAAVAVPAGHAGHYHGGYEHSQTKHINANFDDLSAFPVISDLTPIGPYQYLDYQGLSAGTETAPVVGQLVGVIPHSPPNYAYSSPITEVFVGPALVADYAGSKTKYFDLKSFYFACVDIDSSPVATPENCTITVTGYRDGYSTVTQEFLYDKDVLPFRTELDAPMTLGKFHSDFSKLSKATITYERVNDIDTPPALLLDNVKYTVYLGHY